MSSTKRFICFSVLVLLFVSACTSRKEMHVVSMYYWRTTWNVSQQERKWMDSVGVEKMYLRMFDVVADASEHELGMRPEASFHGFDALASTTDSVVARATRNIVPVVFIAPGVLTKNDGHKTKKLARALLTRIDQMMKSNDLPEAKEIQIDYDWAQSNQSVYFAMLQSLADTLHAEGRVLSTTIRLHQLALAAPPVDRGVLMLYNTGRLQDPNETNSILSKESVEPYLRHLQSYSLPLSLALPQFSWNVVFRENKFAFIAPGLNLQDTSSFVRIDSTHWRSVAYQSVPATASAILQSCARIYPGDVIRREESHEELNQRMVERIEGIRPAIVDELIYFK